MKRFIKFIAIFITAVLLNTCIVSCSTDDETDYSSNKGKATAIIDSDSGKKAKVKWVQLWQDGPKFAEYNVGVIDGKPESFGSQFQWSSFFDEDSQISTFPWGENWRMPTKEEFELLMRYCAIEWTTINNVQGLMVSGVGDFSNNNIFLPACNYDDDEYIGRYWSSTPESYSNAYWFRFREKGSIPEVVYNGKHRYMYIRPVLAEKDNKKDNKEDNGSASEELNAKFIGTWDGKITTDGVTFNAIIVINSDGTYIEISESGFRDFSGKWTINGNGTVTLTNFFDPTFIYTLNGDKLLLIGNDWSGSFTRRH